MCPARGCYVYMRDLPRLFVDGPDDLFVGCRDGQGHKLVPCIKVFPDLGEISTIQLAVSRIDAHMPYPVGKNVAKLFFVF